MAVVTQDSVSKNPFTKETEARHFIKNILSHISSYSKLTILIILIFPGVVELGIFISSGIFLTGFWKAELS